MMSQTFYRVCVIALVGVVAGGAHSTVRPVSTKREIETRLREAMRAAPSLAPAVAPPNGDQQPQPAAGQLASSQPDETSNDVSIAQAKALFDSGALFVDARNREEYLAGHVSDAFLLPVEVFSAGNPDALNYMDKASTLIIYCGGGACDASHNTALRLLNLGYTNLRIMTDGYPAWASAGHPTATGAPAYEMPGGGS